MKDSAKLGAVDTAVLAITKGMTTKRKLVVSELLQGLGEELEWDSERGTDKQVAAVYAAAGELWRQAKGV